MGKILISEQAAKFLKREGKFRDGRRDSQSVDACFGRFIVGARVSAIEASLPVSGKKPRPREAKGEEG